MRLDELNNIFFEEQWAYIEKEIIKLIKILEGSPDQPPFDAKDYIMLYTMIYNLSIQKSPYEYPRQLYDRFKQIFDHYIVTKVLLSLKEKHDEYLLRELVIRWKNHKVMVKWLQRFFHYIDRFYVVQNGVLELRVVGLTSFHDLVYKEYYANARDTVITLINREREGEQIDGSLLKNTIDIFVEIGMGNMDLYENDFEKQLLDDTANYYKNRAANWIEDDSCPDYMLKAEDCMKKEKERASRYLYPSSEQKLLERVQHLLLETHANQLFLKEHSGCLALFRDDKVEDLSRMYRLYHNLPKCLEYVASLLKQHVKAEGTALIKEAEEANKNQVLVREFIELHDKYMPYVNECFMRHILFYKELKEAFTVFCNKTIAGITSAELLATFCDSILKKGGREKLSDNEIEETLEKMVWLLSHVDDKDLLAEFCSKKLARRLLFDRSASEDHEMSFLSKLKGQFGAHFTSKMEGMIIDLTLAGDHQIKNRIQEFIQSVTGIDFTVTVLTSGIWPSYKSFDLNLPSEMAKCLDIFKRFYELKTNRRKLTWIYSLGICNIIGMFEPKTIELITSTYQAAVLLLFNKADRLSYSEIKAELNVTNEDLVRLLHSLSSARYQILIKEPNTGTISPNDSFEFNSKFTDRMRRIKIPLPPVDERKKVIEDVAKDRRYAIDAAIVRIMKSRKILSYQQIVAECMEMLSPTFKPDVKEIKRRIEDLVNRDYLERDSKNSDLFNYRA